MISVNAESESFTVSNVAGNFKSQRGADCTGTTAGSRNWVNIPCATDVPNSVQNSDQGFCSYMLCGSYFSAMASKDGPKDNKPLDRVYSLVHIESKKLFFFFYRFFSNCSRFSETSDSVLPHGYVQQC